MSDEETRRATLAEAKRSIEDLARGEPLPSPALERLAEGVRRVSRWMLVERDEAELERAAEALESLAEELGAGADGPPSRFTRPLSEAGELLANTRGSHPLLGLASPVAPPIHLSVEGDRVLGDVRFDLRFEGNTGWVHGGFVAAGFDIVVVQGTKFSGLAGPTGMLSVRYRAPTPIGVDLRYEAWLDRVEGRKLFGAGRLVRVDDGTVTAEAETIVIAPR